MIAFEEEREGNETLRCLRYYEASKLYRGAKKIVFIMISKI
jgi:hypothetical protein